MRYDGLTQSLDPRTGRRDAGRAGPLYDLPGWTAAAPACPDGLLLAAPGFGFSGEDEERRVTCEPPAATATPYADGLGWAAPGRTWLSVTLLTSADSPFVYWPSQAAEPNALYLLRLASSALTVAGRPPAATRPYYQQTAAELGKDGRTGAYYLFDVPAGTAQRATLHQVYVDGDASADAPPGAPRRASATADLTITLTPAR